MSELYLMTAIITRDRTKNFAAFYDRYGVSVNFITLGNGTAGNEILDYFGLDGTEKAVIFSVVKKETWKQIKTGLQKEMQIDIPGTGIAFIIPLSSIGGLKQLYFLTGSQSYEKKEESVLKDTKYELLIIIANQGYTEKIMDAARKMDAGGGTVIHAKGTGMESADKFLGVTLASEKELIFIVVKKEQKNAIMQAVMDEAGLSSPAKSVVFSLPVTETAGMRLLEAYEAEEETAP
ncbi:MAG: P-II family nitrogen regulator [Lachnospiraceae bacterium]|nr:P-II family nitrogen regulator [Lachnospiraceae bacterium]